MMPRAASSASVKVRRLRLPPLLLASWAEAELTVETVDKESIVSEPPASCPPPFR